MGAGATAMPHIYQGFRLIMEDVLKCLADAQQQFGGPLRAKAIRAIMEEKRKAPIPGCPRTFTRGLVRVLAETGLGERVGRRFQLHLADWQRVIAMLRANYTPKVSTTGRASPTVPSSMPSSSRADTSASAPSTVSPPPASMGEPPVGDLGERPVGDLSQSAHDPGLVEPVVGGWRRTLRKDGRPTYYASDIAYHYDKFVKRGFSFLIRFASRSSASASLLVVTIVMLRVCATIRRMRFGSRSTCV